MAENWFEVETLSPKMYGLGYKDSALHNAEVDTARKGSNNLWLAPEGLRVRSQHGVLVCVGEIRRIPKKTEVGACRRALGLGRYTRANSVPRRDQRMRAT